MLQLIKPIKSKGIILILENFPNNLCVKDFLVILIGSCLFTKVFGS